MNKALTVCNALCCNWFQLVRRLESFDLSKQVKGFGKHISYTGSGTHNSLYRIKVDLSFWRLRPKSSNTSAPLLILFRSGKSIFKPFSDDVCFVIFFFYFSLKETISTNSGIWRNLIALHFTLGTVQNGLLQIQFFFENFSLSMSSSEKGKTLNVFKQAIHYTLLHGTRSEKKLLLISFHLWSLRSSNKIGYRCF